MIDATSRCQLTCETAGCYENDVSSPATVIWWTVKLHGVRHSIECDHAGCRVHTSKIVFSLSRTW